MEQMFENLCNFLMRDLKKYMSKYIMNDDIENMQLPFDKLIDLFFFSLLMIKFVNEI